MSRSLFSSLVAYIVSAVRSWINREDIDFSSVDDVAPTQEWELSENPQGEIEYPTRYRLGRVPRTPCLAAVARC